MAKGKFVSYLRVSTNGQGQSGLGLEAQRKAVEDYLNGERGTLIEEFVSLSSRHARCPNSTTRATPPP
jgi:hypothetical protein